MWTLIPLIACSGEPIPAAEPEQAPAAPALVEAMEPAAADPSVDSGREPIGFVDGVDEVEPAVEEPPPPTPAEYRSEAKEILAGLATGIDAGDRIHRLRISDVAACRGQAGSAQAAIADLRPRSEALPATLQKYVLAVANDVDICLNCDDTAMMMCQVSRETLSTARRAVEAWQGEAPSE